MRLINPLVARLAFQARSDGEVIVPEVKAEKLGLHKAGIRAWINSACVAVDYRVGYVVLRKEG